MLITLLCIAECEEGPVSTLSLRRTMLLSQAQSPLPLPSVTLLWIPLTPTLHKRSPFVLCTGMIVQPPRELEEDTITQNITLLPQDCNATVHFGRLTVTAVHQAHPPYLRARLVPFSVEGKSCKEVSDAARPASSCFRLTRIMRYASSSSAPSRVPHAVCVQDVISVKYTACGAYHCCCGERKFKVRRLTTFRDSIAFALIRPCR